MSSNNTTVPAWERRIRNRASLSGSSPKTEPNNSLHMLKAAPSLAASRMSDASLPEDVKSQLIGILITNIQTIQTQTGTFTDTVQNLKNTPPNRDRWKDTIQTATQLAVRNLEDRMDAATDNAIQIIDTLPESQQDSAADIFSDGLDVVGQTVNQAIQAMRDVMRYLEQFLSGNWHEVTNFHNMVVGLCNGALKTLNSMS